MSLCVLPWEVVTRLKLEPVGPIKADVLGLRYAPEHCEACGEEHAAAFHIAEPRRLAQFREALGLWVDSPTGLRRPEKTPFYTALRNCHIALTEEGL